MRQDTGRPPSDHFDGERFFNPGDRAPDGSPPAHRRFSIRRFARFAFGLDRTPWPSPVPVTQTVPPPRVGGDDLRLTWIGHSSVLVQTQGLNILTDPVWSMRASPLPFAGPKRAHVPGVAFEALPRIDLVLVSHGHYDHLDVPTLKLLWARDRPRILLPLGNDAVLRRAGIASEPHDWNDRIEIAPGVAVLLDRVHHWTSRRGVDRNRALWAGFTLALPGGNLFYAGDTAMADGGWIAEAAARGPIRLAILPIGAYRPRELMAPSHVDPDEAAAIFARLGARHALAVHWGTFQLSEEAINDPPRRLAAALAAGGIAPGRFRALAPGEQWSVPRDE